MIFARIATPHQHFEFQLPEIAGTTAGEGYVWLANRLTDTVTDQPYSGLIMLPGRIIQIPDPADVKSLDVWEEQSGPLIDSADLGALQRLENRPTWETLETTYLGNKLEIQIVSVQQQSNNYVMPMQVNGQPALDVLAADRLGGVVEQAFRSAGVGAIIIIPPVTITSQMQAVNYLMDYAAQVAPPTHFSPADKTGRAMGGLWNDKQ